MEEASLSRKAFWEANFGVEGLDTNTVKVEGARLLRKLHESERVFLLGLVAVQAKWGVHLDRHVAIDEPRDIVSDEANEQWTGFAKWLLQGDVEFLLYV